MIKRLITVISITEIDFSNFYLKEVDLSDFYDNEVDSSYIHLMEVYINFNA